MATSNTCAISLVLPQHLVPKLQALGGNRYSLFDIKLVFPCLPYSDLSHFIPQISHFVSQLVAFAVNFSKFAVQKKGDRNHLVLRPDANTTALVGKIQEALMELLRLKNAAPFVPCIDLGPIADAALARAEKGFKTITVPMNDVYVLTREGGAREFVLRHSFAMRKSPAGMDEDFSTLLNAVIKASASLTVDESASHSNNNTNTPNKTTTTTTTENGKHADKKGKKSANAKSNEPKKANNANDKMTFYPCIGFIDGEWKLKEMDAVADARVASHLRIATFNVLFDLHLPDQIHTALRIPAILDHLEALDADVIGLQEVTKDFMAPLMQAEWVRKKYFVSQTHIAYYDQLLLSKLPFVVGRVVLGKPVKQSLAHTAKKAVVGEFVLNGRRIHVAVVHLTSDKSENAVEKRKLQLSQLEAELLSRGKDNFIIGDFNFGDDGVNVIPASYADAWKTLCPNDDGFTYSATNNTLAAILSERQVDARFDRILCESTLWTPKTIQMFACEAITKVNDAEIFASDHFGLVASYEFAPPPSQFGREFSARFSTDPLYQYLHQRHALPDAKYTKSREKIFRFLEAAMANVCGDQDWKLHLVGSSRLGVDVSGSDVDVVVVSKLSRDQFFEYAAKVLSAQESVSNLRAIKEAIVPVIKLSLGGVEVDIQYCCLPADAALSESMLNIDELVLLRMDKASFSAVAAIRDFERLSETVPDFDSFRLLLFYVKLWAKKRMVYSASIGFLGGFSLAILAARICNSYPNLTPSQLVSKFFEEYAAWNPQTTPVSLPGVGFPTLDLKRHLLPVFTPTKPFKIAPRNATHTTRDLLMRELQRAAKIVCDSERTSPFWDELVEPATMAGFGANLILDVTAANEQELQTWAGFVESRIVDLIIQLENALRDRTPRAALRPCDHRIYSASNPVRAYFVVAIDVPREECPALAQLVGARIDFGAFTRWAQMTPTTNLSVDVMGDIAGILQDREEKKGKKEAEVGEFQPVLLEDGAEQVLDLVQEEQQQIAATNNYAEASKKKQQGKKKQQAKEDFSEKKMRMRTSIEVFNRIKWDNSLPKSEFIVGYEDRFIGIMEVPFDEFDIETIPLHRVRIFKRNGVTVWSRDERIDAVFKYT